MKADFEHLLNSAIAQSNHGNQPEAIRLLLSCLKQQPGNAWVLLNLANCHIKNNQDEKASECFAEILNLNIRDVQILLNLNQLAIRVYRFDHAAAACEQALQLAPHSPDVLAALIEAKKEARKRSGLNKLCKKMISLLPNHWWAYSQLAGNHLINGEFEQAQAQYQEAQKCDPQVSFIYPGLVKSTKFKQLPQQLLQQIDTAISANEDIEAKARLLLAKAKIYNDCGQYDEAWQQAAKAKSLKSAQAEFNPSAFRQHVQAIKSHYSDSVNHPDSGSDSDPVFIIGMPRSGTTLIEQVLSGFPDLYPGGETPALDNALFQVLKGQSYLQLSSELNEEQLQQLAQEYEAFFRRFSNFNGRRIIDKIPMNFMHVGLIKQVFPRAKFINFDRNKLDVATSIFFENFSMLYKYTNDLDAILQVCDHYQELMVFWEKKYPEDILTISYDEFVSHYDECREKILQFTEVFDESDFNYQKSDNEIETPSVWQARQPIYKTSVNRWKRYSEMNARFGQD